MNINKFIYNFYAIHIDWQIDNITLPRTKGNHATNGIDNYYDLIHSKQ